MENNVNIHWFPGHMMKTLRLIEKELHNVDVMIELLDARIPHASKNPELAQLTAGKPRLLVLNKSDLANPDATTRWLNYYRGEGYGAVSLSSKDRRAAGTVIDAAISMRRNNAAAQLKPRAMVIGIPNVGKSTFINCLAGGAPAKAEDRPGVTRGKQWIALPKLDLLDMPGVLWRKLENQDDAQLLAFTGAIKDAVLDTEEMAVALLRLLRAGYADALCARYKLQPPLTEDAGDLLEQIAKKRGMLLSGGVADTERAAIMLLDELRGGLLGRITFEEPPAP